MRTKQQIAECMLQVLTEKMQHADWRRFHSDAHLREDLALDSSATLELLVHLELEFGLGLPEDALMSQDLETVRSVAKLLFEAQPRSETFKILEYDEDIKLHCFVSCLSEVLKRCPEIDQRVLYFGVWDSEVIVSEQCVLSYHSETISHQFFVDWCQKLYGLQIEAWYRPERSKAENIEHLATLVQNRARGQHIMAMVDMFQLPERSNEFSKDPFPHYLMVGPTAAPDAWMVDDPDYRWEGVLEKSRVENAARQPTVSGGYVLWERGVRPPRPGDISAYYQASMNLRTNPVTEAVRGVVRAHLLGRDRKGHTLALSQLGRALEELPVLSIRKYAYEHGLAFFWRELSLPEEEFDGWCEVIAELVKTYKLVHFHAVKLAMSGDRALGQRLLDLLDEQDRREFRVKRCMDDAYHRWCAVTLPSKQQSAMGAAS